MMKLCVDPMVTLTAIYTVFTALLFITAFLQFTRNLKQHRTLLEHQSMSELEAFTSKKAEYLNEIIFNKRTQFAERKPEYSNAICQAMTIFLQTLDNRIERSIEKNIQAEIKKYLRKQYWVQIHPEHRVRLKYIFNDYLNTLTGEETDYQLLKDRREDFSAYFKDY